MPKASLSSLKNTSPESFTAAVLERAEPLGAALQARKDWGTGSFALATHHKNSLQVVGVVHTPRQLACTAC